MSYVVSLKAALKTPKPKPRKDSGKLPIPAGTFSPQELVLRPTPLRRYFE